jgi:hypothetical protein
MALYLPQLQTPHVSLSEEHFQCTQPVCIISSSWMMTFWFWIVNLAYLKLPCSWYTSVGGLVSSASNQMQNNK